MCKFVTMCGITSYVLYSISFACFMCAKINGKYILIRNKREAAPEAFVFRSDGTVLSSNQTINVDSERRFYNYTYYPEGRALFYDVKKLDDGNAKHRSGLSMRYASAMREYLKFEFAFYGHRVKDLIITTGGFLFIGPKWHSYVTETHYIAPLMANFNPNTSSDAKIFVYSSDKMFIAQWDQVSLSDQRDVGTFTFQVQIYPNGSIVFAYESIPMQLHDISTEEHAVRVGISNALIRNISIDGKYYNEIVRYHTLKLPFENTKDHSGYVINALPSCVCATSCSQCHSGMFGPECKWCDAIEICSDNTDWYSQKWIDHKCPTVELEKCKVNETITPNISAPIETPIPYTRKSDKGLTSTAKGIIVASVFSAVILVTTAGFLIWVFRNSKALSGLLLLQCVPNNRDRDD